MPCNGVVVVNVETGTCSRKVKANQKRVYNHLVSRAFFVVLAFCFFELFDFASFLF